MILPSFPLFLSWRSLNKMWLIFLIVILLLAVFRIRSWAFALAFLAGLILDLLRLGILGATSLFFLIFILTVLLYERKFEIQTGTFVFLISFLAGLLYLWLIGSTQIIWGALIASLFSVFAFKVLIGFFGKKLRENY